PSESFAINKPTILLDIYGGPERENAIFFEQMKLAEINRDYDQLGSQAKSLLGDPERLRVMSENQLEFKNSLNLKAIADFALHATTRYDLGANLGVEDMRGVFGAEDALTRLEADAPADVEILLSYGKFANEKSLIKMIRDGNPFGHMAI